MIDTIADLDIHFLTYQMEMIRDILSLKINDDKDRLQVCLEDINLALLKSGYPLINLFVEKLTAKVENPLDVSVKEINKSLSEAFLELMDIKLNRRLNISLEQIKEILAKSIVDRAEELALECPSIAPYEDYGKLLENNDDMTHFFKTEASKPENLILTGLDEDAKFKQLIKFSFSNKSVDHLMGTVFLSKSGVVKHCFPRIEV